MADQRPEVKLPTWVNVVLILILLASCGSAGDSAVQINNNTDESLKQVCTVLGAVAKKQGLTAAELQDAMNATGGSGDGPCAQVIASLQGSAPSQ
ncbi:MAG: hypothetical protein LWW86_05290 [Micrococcales bacterium]|nr:hypothetical protein [Micrococcales bacterium]